MAAINVRNLCKTYGTRIAVDDLSVTIEDGEVFALLGPNGAGKTTTVKRHLLRAFAKLGVSDRTAAVTSAQATGQL
jgi:ABC-type Fe3+/spermidine/putrescine transport system ATPase subunit